MIDEWMIGLGISVAGAISTYAVLRSNVERLKLDLEQHVGHDDRLHEREHSSHARIHGEFTEKINAGFKRVDELSEKVTILKQDTANLLTMKVADDKFVSKDELKLYLRNIELQTSHTDKTINILSSNITAIMGKLDEINLNLKG